ncbi:MAG: beta-ureidopropionase [Deinococcota bacterium]|jgi:predicted amidohydrolase|nr:beta-ureidopropionase [Deinococcota bacterium]
MIRHALVQFTPVKGQLRRNLARLSEILRRLEEEEVGVLCLPETSLSGYFLQAGVREQAIRAEALYELLGGCLAEAGWKAPLDICLGFYERDGGDFYNSALYAEFGTAEAGIKHVHRKLFLPSYGVFDEERFVTRGRHVDAFDTRFGRAGMLICEDAWHSSTAAVLALKGADVLYIPTASPARDFAGSVPANARRWLATAEGIAAEHGVFVLTSGLTGFEGGKGFTGLSNAVDPRGRVIAEAPLFTEAVLLVDIFLEAVAVARYENPLLADLRANLPELVRAFEEANSRP